MKQVSVKHGSASAVSIGKTRAMASLDPAAPDFAYDELAYFHENCAEHDLEPQPVEVVRGETLVDAAAGRHVRWLRWGSGAPRVVLLHGGAQNAHTWDTVALALRPVPLLAIDLPGHGHSDWREDRQYGPVSNAADVAAVIAAEAPDADLLVGMSLGGLTATAVAARHPDLVRSLLVVDVTPGVDEHKAKAVHDFIAGPQDFPSFSEIFERTVQFNPTRSASSLRRGIIHNAHPLPDGSWEWNYDRRPLTQLEAGLFANLWDDVSAVKAPYCLVRGGDSPVVDDADVAEVRRRQPDLRYELIEGAGHSIQGDRPLELAALIRDLLA